MRCAILGGSSEYKKKIRIMHTFPKGTGIRAIWPFVCGQATCNAI